MIIKWNINRQRQRNGMDVLQTIEVNEMNKHLLVDIVDSDCGLSIGNRRLYVGKEYLEQNGITSEMIAQVKTRVLLTIGIVN